MFHRIAMIVEDIMVEQHPPARKFGCWQVLHCDRCVIERVGWSQQRRFGIAPPEIDHRAELVERRNRVPPEARDIDGITAAELRLLRAVECLSESGMKL